MEYVRTFREMLITPGKVVDSFVLDEKSNYMHPFSFGLIGVIIVIALYSLVLGYRTPILAEFVSKEIDQYQQLTYWIQYADLKLSTFLLPLLMFLLLIPSLAIPGLFFFRENIEGFYYNLILSAYAVGTAVVSLLVLVPIWLVSPSTLFNSTITTYMPLVLVGIVVLRIYERYFLMEGIKSWIQILSSYTLGCILFLVLESFSISIIGYFIFAVNRFIDLWMTI
ncbi:DUF3667 domain-containing protein [Rhodohalobacter sulfatireducens]|uniref:DUF3667 domain-containing protein n=1 Tax=Rhodohalobacter sulfatireducens TaxID=2911366 RepID=A0ABS9KIN6_9BACT|nr:DUF3667 domain-containing protein [Rhodohalobacter sulfatireducens]MCG2590691.1 DUF3667 domain-containing protein [Rhodohalobacter sulfatireducens]